MTVDQWWKEIEAFCLSGDWNGLLVAADGLEELGEGEVAGTIRWAVRRQRLPEWREYANQKWHYRFPVWHSDEIQLYAETDCRIIWMEVFRFRNTLLEFYQ